LGGALAGGLGTEVSRGVQGQSPGGGLGTKPPEARRMLRHEAETITYGEKKTSPYRLTFHDNPLILLCSQPKRSLRAPEPGKWSTMAADSVVHVQSVVS